MRSIAVLGVGTMGAGMARRLLKAGFAVTVYNRTRARAEALLDAGAAIANTPREAAGNAEAAIAMLADDRASRAAWLGPDGALAGVRPGTVLMESSTLSAAWVLELAAAAAARGCPFLEAPVTGSKPQAESGELVFLAAGDAATLDAMRPALTAMGRATVPLGPVGSGATMKLVNNFMAGVQAASLAEAVAIIERSGLNRDVALRLLCDGPPGSPMVKKLVDRMAANDYRVNFGLDLMVKDLTYALAEAARHGVRLATGEAGLELFRAASAAGYGSQDMAAVVEPLRHQRI